MQCNKNSPYFPCGFRIRAKIRENTYHFIRKGSTSFEKWGKFRKSLHKYRFVTHRISYFFFNYIHLILIHCLSTCFCNQHPVNLHLHCFLCIFIEMITDNIDCLPDFLCKCVTLCFCIHHFFHNHFSFLLEPQQRVIPLVSVRTLFFQSGPKWALPVS